MKQFEQYPYFKPLEDIVDVLGQRTTNADRSFYRNLVNFYFSQVASSMRCTVKYINREAAIPINFYGISFGHSGMGKNLSSNIIIDEVLADFRKEFIESTHPYISNFHVEKIAKRISAYKGTDYDEELIKVQKEYEELGSFLFSFDSGTLPGMKQLRQKLIMGNIGALSFIADEIGSNITEVGVSDLLKGFLELYDIGLIGDKLLKNSKDSPRNTQRFGRTPANMMLFGTQSKLFDGGANEKAFRSLLTTGMARRCFFAFSEPVERKFTRSAEQIYDDLNNDLNYDVLLNYKTAFKDLADTMHYGKELTVNRQGGILIQEYKKQCEELGQRFNDNEEEKKAELAHSYFKMIKLAGTYAFIDGKDEIGINHIKSAIRYALDSSSIFQKKVMEQDPPHIKLLKYLCGKSTSSTYADMAKDLQNFPKTIAQRAELFTLAASEGYASHISLIHKDDNGIDLFSAKKLEETNLEEIILSYSDKISRDYKNIEVEFSKIGKLTQEEGYHWVNHHLEDGNRSESDVIMGFNLVVLDLDKNVDVSTVKMVLGKYMFHLHSTKRHTKDKPRFRVILPLSHIVSLSPEHYSKFIRNIYDWLPFSSDEVTNQRSRKWLCCRGSFIDNEGTELLDAHQFIPQTTKAIALNTINTKHTNIPQLERWYMRQVNEGAGRNNTLIKYAFVLVDLKMSHRDIMIKVSHLNREFSHPLTEVEIMSTISTTISKKVESAGHVTVSSVKEDDVPF